MPMGGDGPWAVAVMWVMTALTLVFTVLRLYTRLIVIKSYGIDDSVYVFAFLCLTGYSIFITVAAEYGFGQNMWDIENPRDTSTAILNEAISQTFAVLGMAVAKWSMGLFLLRVVNITWQRIAIWSVMSLLMGASISCIFCFWIQCTPFPYLWDRTIEGGYCDLPQLPISIILGTSCVFADLFFAVFPWIALWRLQMNPREKNIILGSMSLGFMSVLVAVIFQIFTNRTSAAAFGTKRATEIPELMSSNYLKDTVGIIVWSAAEMAVTMICIGIPICRPLYKKQLERWLLPGEEKFPDQFDIPYPLHTFGGSTMIRPGQETAPQSKKGSANRTGESTLTEQEELDVEAEERKLGVKGPFSVAYAVGGKDSHVDYQSDEWPLRNDRRQNLKSSDVHPSDGEQAMHVVDECQVTTTDKQY